MTRTGIGRGALVLGGLLAVTSPSARGQAPPAPAGAEPSAVGFVLARDRVVLPLVMVREYPFVRAVVNGVPGKLLLDTGGPDALVLNDHRVPLPGARTVGSSFYGSGQHYDEHVNAAIDSVVIATPSGPLRYRRVRNVPSWDGTQLEQHITPDFLGWIGYSYFRGHAMKLDYRRGEATFYPSGPGAPQDYLAGETVVARIPYELRRRPNDPIVHVRVGSVDFVGSFDTGQYGTLYTTEATRQQLVREGAIRPAPDGSEDPIYDVAGLTLGGAAVGRVPHVEVRTTPFDAARGIGLTEPNVITIGYGVLRQFTTVWDFPRRTIYLLAP